MWVAEGMAGMLVKRVVVVVKSTEKHHEILTSLKGHACDNDSGTFPL